MQLFDFKSSVIEILGGLDIIINCAGAIFDGDVEKTFPQDYDYLIDVNLRSIFALILHFKTYLEKGSCVVNVSCLNGSRPQAGLASYCMTKAGLEIMTKFAAAEFAHLGVRVNGVSSCAVDTNILRSVGIDEKEYSDYKTRVSNNIPLGRIAKPEDVAKQIIFLCSKRSSKITGQILKVDGGKSLTSSGYTPWKGLKNMNARFEPSDVNSNYKVLSIWSNLSKKNVNKNYPNTEEEIEKLLNETNWATRLSEAHEKVTASYKSIDQNDNFLVNKFVKKN
jgi:enoyl-[acyl-carrier-protein] reductase (NADH)